MTQELKDAVDKIMADKNLTQTQKEQKLDALRGKKTATIKLADIRKHRQECPRCGSFCDGACRN